MIDRPSLVTPSRHQPTLRDATMRLYIVHSHPVVEESLRITLELNPDVEIVGTQLDTDRVEERVLLSQATLLVLDGSVRTTRLVQIINRVSPVVKVVVLVNQEEPEQLVRCLTAGASGYLCGRRGLGEIAAALQRAHDGWAILTAEQVSTLIIRSRIHAPDDHAIELCACLSGRERDVLRLVATGDSIDEVATRLGISSYTVQTHLKNVMRKLNARTRLAAVVLAVRAGILDEPDQ